MKSGLMLWKQEVYEYWVDQLMNMIQEQEAYWLSVRFEEFEEVQRSWNGIPKKSAKFFEKKLKAYKLDQEEIDFWKNKYISWGKDENIEVLKWKLKNFVKNYFFKNVVIWKVIETEKTYNVSKWNYFVKSIADLVSEEDEKIFVYDFKTWTKFAKWDKFDWDVQATFLQKTITKNIWKSAEKVIFIQVVWSMNKPKIKADIIKLIKEKMWTDEKELKKKKVDELKIIMKDNNLWIEKGVQLYEVDFKKKPYLFDIYDKIVEKTLMFMSLYEVCKQKKIYFYKIDIHVLCHPPCDDTFYIFSP